MFSTNDLPIINAKGILDISLHKKQASYPCMLYACTHVCDLKVNTFYFLLSRQLVLALDAEQNQLKSIRNKIQEVNWQRKQEQVC